MKQIKPIERDIVIGLTSLLNEVSEKYHSGKPILTDEQYDVRLRDLKEAEQETGFMLFNSPNCPIDIKSITRIKKFPKDNYKTFRTVEEIAAFSENKKMIAYIDMNGLDMSVTYVDGIINKIYLENAVFNVRRINNIPYKINRNGTYTVQGKVTLLPKQKFLVTDVIDGASNRFEKSLNSAKKIGFDMIPYWSATNFNVKNLQSNIEYVFEYAQDEKLSCDGIVFRFDDKKLNNKGCYYERSIV